MGAGGLFETAVALGVNALVASIAVAQIAVAGSLERTLRSRTAASVELRLVEHLVDSALDDGANGGASGAALVAVDEVGLEVHIDRNGDGSISLASHERLRLLVRSDGRDRVRLLHGLGRQTMTVAAGLGFARIDSARIATDPDGRGASALVSLTANPPGARARHLTFAVVTGSTR